MFIGLLSSCFQISGIYIYLTPWPLSDVRYVLPVPLSGLRTGNQLNTFSFETDITTPTYFSPPAMCDIDIYSTDDIMTSSTVGCCLD